MLEFPPSSLSFFPSLIGKLYFETVLFVRNFAASKDKSINRSLWSIKLQIMKTLKNLAIIAMMTMFGANTMFAATTVKNDKNHGFKNNHATMVVHGNQAYNNNAANDFARQYENARHCNCKACRELVKKVEQHIKQQMRYNKKQCHCQYCTYLTMMAHKNVYNVKNNVIYHGRR